MPVNNYITFDGEDVTETRTLLHEVLPLTGTIVSGTYGGTAKVRGDEKNVKNYAHGQFQSVYDYAYLSSSANHIFDITMGFDETSLYSSSVYTGAARVQQSKKINMYNQFAQVLLGFTGSTDDGIRKFESDLNLDGTNQMKEVFFLTFSRLLTKDQIKKGTFSISIGTGSFLRPFNSSGSTANAGVRTLSDVSASVTATNVGVADGGEYGLLFDTAGVGGGNKVHGLVFYQAGVVVLSASAFTSGSTVQKAGGGAAMSIPICDGGSNNRAGEDFIRDTGPFAGRLDMVQTFQSASISSSANGLRHRIQNISFNNTTEINSKIYFCRVPFGSYNYSTNPTYTSGSKIRVKNVATDNPVAYVTTVGLYNTGGELLAVAKLSEPLRKDPTNDMTIRVRLDY